MTRYLLELKGDYKRCFEFYMDQPSEAKRVIDIESSLTNVVTFKFNRKISFLGFVRFCRRYITMSSIS